MPRQSDEQNQEAKDENPFDNPPTTEEAGEDDEESVYMKDNVVMRRIQIEGE